MNVEETYNALKTRIAHGLNPKMTVMVREVYGVTKYYPHCDTSKLFASIAGTKTLTNHTLVFIEQLGYEINKVHIGAPRSR